MSEIEGGGKGHEKRERTEDRQVGQHSSLLVEAWALHVGPDLGGDGGTILARLLFLGGERELVEIFDRLAAIVAPAAILGVDETVEVGVLVVGENLDPIGANDLRVDKDVGLLRVVPRLGVLIAVTAHADGVVEDGELDVAVALLDGGVERPALILADVPKDLEELLLPAGPERRVHANRHLLIGPALEGN